MAKATQKVTPLRNAWTYETVANRMDELHVALAAGIASRETAMIYICEAVEHKALDIDDGKNEAFKALFVRFRDGKNATETSDLALRSRFQKAATAAMLCRDAETPFTATLATVADLHADATAAAKKDKKLPEAEQVGAEYPRQLIEAYYEAAKLQVDSESSQPIDEDVLLSKAVEKPGKQELNDGEKFLAYINAIVEKFNPLIGGLDIKKNKPKKLGLSADTINALKAARNTIAKFAQPVTAEDLQAAKDRADAEAYRQMQAEQAAKKTARDAKKNGTPAK